MNVLTSFLPYRNSRLYEKVWNLLPLTLTLCINGLQKCIAWLLESLNQSETSSTAGALRMWRGRLRGTVADVFSEWVGCSHWDDGLDNPVSVVMSSVISYGSIRIFDVWGSGEECTLTKYLCHLAIIVLNKYTNTLMIIHPHRTRNVLMFS